MNLSLEISGEMEEIPTSEGIKKSPSQDDFSIPSFCF